MFFQKQHDNQLEYKFVFKENALANIMSAKGWDSYSDMARELGYTRQYISMLDKPDAEITHQVMLSIAIALGSLDKNWWVHYRIVPKGERRPDHPRNNFLKHRGVMPYRPHSPLADFRSLDSPTETRK